MPLQLSIATEDDIPQITKFQFAAFHPENRMHRLIYPSPLPVPDSIISSTIQRTLKAWREDKEHITWVIIKDTDTKVKDLFGDGKEKDRVIAAAKWIIWPPGETLKEGETRWPDKIDAAWVKKSDDPEKPNFGNGAADDKEYVEWVMEEFFERRRERIVGPAVLLDVCCTDPEYHRRGAGKMLVRWGTGKADELGVKAFVEASPEGRRLYESCGFMMVEDVVLRGGKVNKKWEEYGEPDWGFMVREKRGKN
ncbi:uncharacterized protein PAC_03627 [Phialocephala subalpina]|uniref:N-acetyltransferase domain-containing protein n=1 Tax=Phialocephala subalpina TaxID=576137 RepID=A0A1L7WLU6_9HELO|nr:uncharacterized protein PAC_03627 [Phialocephala subalpina]